MRQMKPVEPACGEFAAASRTKFSIFHSRNLEILFLVEREY